MKPVRDVAVLGFIAALAFSAPACAAEGWRIVLGATHAAQSVLEFR